MTDSTISLVLGFLPLMLIVGGIYFGCRPTKSQPITGSATPLGYGGWLVFFSVSLVLGALIGLGQMRAELRSVENVLHGMPIPSKVDAYLTVMSLGAWARAVLLIWCVYLLRKRYVRFTVKRVIFAIWLAGPGYIVVLFVAAAQFIPYSQTKLGLINTLLGTTLYTALWTWYLLRSKRVRNTYIVPLRLTGTLMEPEFARSLVSGRSRRLSTPNQNVQVSLPSAIKEPVKRERSASWAVGLLGCLGMLGYAAIFVFMFAQLAIGFLGIAHELRNWWAGAAAIGAVIFGFMLPLTIGAYFGARDVLGWPVLGALVFAAPGLLFLIPGTIAALIDPIRGR